MVCSPFQKRFRNRLQDPNHSGVVAVKGDLPRRCPARAARRPLRRRRRLRRTAGRALGLGLLLRIDLGRRLAQRPPRRDARRGGVEPCAHGLGGRADDGALGGRHVGPARAEVGEAVGGTVERVARAVVRALVEGVLGGRDLVAGVGGELEEVIHGGGDATGRSHADDPWFVEPSMKQYTLIGTDNLPQASSTPGTLGGHRADRIYGTLDCPGAARAIARGGYVPNRVFFADEPTAIAAGYRPCATCLPTAYRTWKEHRAMPLSHITATTPIGELLLLGDDEGLAAIRFHAADVPAGSPPAAAGSVLDDAARQLTEYASGARTAFDVPLRPRFGGAFERRVWAHVFAVPYGTTTTYGDIAHALDAPGAARAVGAANGRNPIPIIVPCHRVIGARGALTGYAGGLDRKRRLLEHEGALLAV